MLLPDLFRRNELMLAVSPEHQLNADDFNSLSASHLSNL